MFEKLKDLLYPEGLVCYVCDREAVLNRHFVCKACAAELKPCPKLPGIRELDDLASGFIYDDATGAAIQRFKYGFRPYMADFFAAYMRIPEHWTIHCIVPVPLAKKRLNERGYNQSCELAVRLGEIYSIPVLDDIVIRVRETKTQTHMTAKMRRKNVKGAFLATCDCKGFNILLVDDVLTTGSTLKECARVLKKAGANRVYAITACATLH